MAHTSPRSPNHRIALAAAACLCAGGIAAQESTPAPAAPPPDGTAAPQRIVITATPGSAPLGVSGFGITPLADTPMQAIVIGPGLRADAGIDTLADLTRLDASTSDAYNAPGYWSFLSVRGYVLDNRSNYRRDGLPINAETALPLDNVSNIEILKGISGLQAGVSAPGGLVNLVVKRPEGRLRRASLGWEQDGSVIASADVGTPFGADDRGGLRLNAAAARLDPQARAARGERASLAAAADWRFDSGAQLEAEAQWSRQSQPSVPGFSLLGDRVPDAGQTDPRINLNNQPWSQPVVLAGTTASLRWRQPLRAGWQFVAHGVLQNLRSDDRIAFPFGCYDETTDTYYADRYCPDGRFDLYDFRSDGEQRRTGAADLRLSRPARTGAWSHQIEGGVLASRSRDRFQRQAFNYVGQGSIDGATVTPAEPALTADNTNRDERAVELYVRDHIQLSADTAAWLGLRHTRLQRDARSTDASDTRTATGYSQAFTTPWAALSQQFSPAWMGYASWGQGIETQVVPGRSDRYTNAGQALPALKSRQLELGLKLQTQSVSATFAAFDIRRPQAEDLGDCATIEGALCTRALDGEARHRGLEVATQWQVNAAWALRASALWLDAQRTGSSLPDRNGLRPVNVPDQSIKLQTTWTAPADPRLALMAFITHEGPRSATPDGSATIPAWTTLDLAARWEQRLQGDSTLTWRLGLNNATNHRAWREAPYQFSHTYLFPLAPRTLRASVQTTF